MPAEKGCSPGGRGAPAAGQASTTAPYPFLPLTCLVHQSTGHRQAHVNAWFVYPFSLCLPSPAGKPHIAASVNEFSASDPVSLSPAHGRCWASHHLTCKVNQHGRWQHLPCTDMSFKTQAGGAEGHIPTLLSSVFKTIIVWFCTPYSSSTPTGACTWTMPQPYWFVCCFVL